MQKFSGKIKAIMPVTERGEWKSVQFVVEEQGVQYPQSAVFVKSAKGDNGKWIDEFAKKNPVGSHVDVDFSIKAREYNGKWYNDVMAFKVENRNYENLVNKAIAEAADAPVSNDDDLGLPF